MSSGLENNHGDSMGDANRISSSSSQVRMADAPRPGFVFPTVPVDTFFSSSLGVANGSTMKRKREDDTEDLGQVHKSSKQSEPIQVETRPSVSTPAVTQHQVAAATPVLKQTAESFSDLPMGLVKETALVHDVNTPSNMPSKISGNAVATTSQAPVQSTSKTHQPANSPVSSLVETAEVTPVYFGPSKPAKKDNATPQPMDISTDPSLSTSANAHQQQQPTQTTTMGLYKGIPIRISPPVVVRISEARKRLLEQRNQTRSARRERKARRLAEDTADGTKSPGDSNSVVSIANEDPVDIKTEPLDSPPADGSRPDKDRDSGVAMITDGKALKTVMTTAKSTITEIKKESNVQPSSSQEQRPTSEHTQSQPTLQHSPDKTKSHQHHADDSSVNTSMQIDPSNDENKPAQTSQVQPPFKQASPSSIKDISGDEEENSQSSQEVKQQTTKTTVSTRRFPSSSSQGEQGRPERETRSLRSKINATQSMFGNKRDSYGEGFPDPRQYRRKVYTQEEQEQMLEKFKEAEKWMNDIESAMRMNASNVNRVIRSSYALEYNRLDEELNLVLRDQHSKIEEGVTSLRAARDDRLEKAKHTLNHVRRDAAGVLECTKQLELETLEHELGQWRQKEITRRLIIMERARIEARTPKEASDLQLIRKSPMLAYLYRVNLTLRTLNELSSRSNGKAENELVIVSGAEDMDVDNATTNEESKDVDVDVDVDVEGENVEGSNSVSREGYKYEEVAFFGPKPKEERRRSSETIGDLIAAFGGEVKTPTRPHSSEQSSGTTLDTAIQSGDEAVRSGEGEVQSQDVIEREQTVNRGDEWDLNFE